METDDNRTRLRTLVQASTATRAVAVAVELGLADLIGDRSAISADLATRIGADKEGILRLLRTLTTLGVLEEVASNTFALTTTGALLRTDRPDSMVEFARLSGLLGDLLDRNNLRAAVVGGKVASVSGTGLFEHLSTDLSLSQTFNTAMRESTRPVARALSEHYDFSAIKTVVDIGGGDGTLLAGVLARNPGMRGTLYDTAEGVAQSTATLEAADVVERCFVRTGDILDSVPEGADLYIIKSVLEDWSDDAAATILENCRNAIPPHGRLLVIEPLLPDRVDRSLSPHPYLMDLMVMTLLGGCLRTASHLTKLCTDARFTVTTFRPLLPPDFSLIEATPVDT